MRAAETLAAARSSHERAVTPAGTGACWAAPEPIGRGACAPAVAGKAAPRPTAAAAAAAAAVLQAGPKWPGAHCYRLAGILAEPTTSAAPQGSSAVVLAGLWRTAGHASAEAQLFAQFWQPQLGAADAAVVSAAQMAAPADGAEVGRLHKSL